MYHTFEFCNELNIVKGLVVGRLSLNCFWHFAPLFAIYFNVYVILIFVSFVLFGP